MSRSRTPSIMRLIIVLIITLTGATALAQNSMIGDGFGGRLWYRPVNYTVGSYSGFSLCYSDPCDSSSNQLYGWGGDNVGEMGNGPGANCMSTPVAIPGMSNVRYYSTGYWMGAIKNDGTGWVWNDPYFPTPTQVITDVKFVDASAWLLSFVKNDGTVWSIGKNDFGQFGDGTTNDEFITPVQMVGVANAVRVAVGTFTSYVLLADSSVLVVGSKLFGLNGDPSNQDSLSTTAVPIPSLAGIVDIKATAIGTAALTGDGDVYSWGQGGYIGNGGWSNDTLPRRLPELNNIVAISGCTDGYHFFALDADKNCYALGQYNFNTYHLAPALIADNVIDIMAGELFSYVVKADGTLWASGSSLCGSIWLDQPNFLHPAAQMVLTQLHPSAVPGSCPLLGTVAIPTATCASGSVTVHHFGGQTPYMYDIGTGPQSSNVFVDVPLGQYNVSVTDADGCVTTIPCTVDPVGLDPIVLDMGTVSACMDEGYTFPSGTTVHTSGSFVDTTFSVLGCDTVRQYNVVLTPLPQVVQGIYLCEGVTYTLPNGDVVTAPGLHFVDTLVYAGACDTVFSILLVLSTQPPIVASIYAPDSVLALGDTVLLAGSTSYGWNWWPSATLSCSTCPFPIATPTETTEYCVEVIGGPNNGSPGCGTDTACITITVLPPVPTTCTALNIFVPTAFSPNSTGKNDMQCVYGGECIKTMTFAIYDRWGNKVFESTDPKACWDGNHKGQPLDPAVFVYHLSATMINGATIEKQGNITLVR